MRDLIVFALPFENQLKLTANNIETFICGVGKINACLSLAKQISKKKYRKIINLGVCGSLNKSIAYNSIYSIDKVFEGEMIDRRKNNSIDLQTLPVANIPLTSLITTDQIINRSFQKEYLSNHSNAFLVDMECYALAKTAQNFNIPFYAIKIVVDFCDEKTKNITKSELIQSAEKICEVIGNSIKD